MTSDSTVPTGKLDELFAHFLAELEHAAQPEDVIRSYCARYPDRARDFRTIVELGHILDRSAKESDSLLPVRLGDFRVIRKIDYGGMGVICEAEQEPLGRSVAVKIIRRGHTLAVARERFLREQQILARLHQSHIVPVFAAGEEGPIQYFAMPFIKGVSLHRLMRVARARSSSSPPNAMPPIEHLVETAAGYSQTGPHRLSAAQDGTGSCLDARYHPALAEQLAIEAAHHFEHDAALLTLSVDYFRSVAKVMFDVAESLHRVHLLGIVHRDVKPANIMLDPAGQSWLIDFGLAGYINEMDGLTSGAGKSQPGRSAILTTGAIGTPGYMAPEQEGGQPLGVRTDVWGLGVTLYELLTLNRAFPQKLQGATASSIVASGPPTPQKLVKNFPRDLEAICVKALQRAPERRYATAQDFADDLKRWLRQEPTVAHGARVPRRAYLWAKRHKGWATSLFLLIFAVSAVVSGAYGIQRSEMKAAQRDVAAAKREAEVIKREERTAASGKLMLQCKGLVGSEHRNGWSDEAWSLCRDVAEIRKDRALRDLTCTTLAGLDARQCRRINDAGATELVFDKDGQRLLLSTVTGYRKDQSGAEIPVPGPARLWDTSSDELRALDSAEVGPVAVSSNKTPLQLVIADSGTSLLLKNLFSHEVLLQFVVPPDTETAKFVDICVTPDGSAIGALVKSAEGKTFALVWDGRTGKLLCTLAAQGVLATLSPDGSLLAAPDEEGHVSVWSVRSGCLLCRLRASRNPVRGLAFGRSVIRTADTTEISAEAGWLLAAGDTGGLVTIWNIYEKIAKSYCRGSHYSVGCLAFSPDGTTLASGGFAEQVSWTAPSSTSSGLILVVWGGWI